MTKIALITGASAGIGRATAELLLANGWKVYGTSRKGTLPWEHLGLIPVSLDLSQPASIDGAITHISQSASHLDLIVNNAGYGTFSSIDDLPDEELRNHFEVLLFGPVRLTKALLPLLETGRGKLINVTSLAARFPIPYLGAYSAAKAAFSSLTQVWQLEEGGTTVRIIDLQPGDIHSEFHNSMSRLPASPRHAAREERCYQSVDHSMNTAPSPTLVASTILRMASTPDNPPREVAGNFLQTRLGPLALRLLPQSGLLWLLRRLYRL